MLNVVPYHQSGNVEAGWAPRWNAGRFDWSAWDRRFGPYFDGSAFADMPRRGVPQACFYLPLNENWPTPIAGNYNGDYWADRAFPKSYRDDFVEASRQMAEHFNNRGWNETLFQCFFNGKNNFKAAGWSRGSSPWLLDEPAHFQDFWALRYFGEAFHEGINRRAGQSENAVPLRYFPPRMAAQRARRPVGLQRRQRRVSPIHAARERSQGGAAADRDRIR